MKKSNGLDQAFNDAHAKIQEKFDIQPLMRADVKKENFITRWLAWRKFKKMLSSTAHNNDTQPTYTTAES